MAKKRAQKEIALQSLQDKLGKAKVIVFATQKGISVKTTQELRRLCKSFDLDVVSCKKNLLKLFLKQENITDLNLNNTDGVVLAFCGYGEETVAPNVLYKFIKGKEGFKILSGILEQKAIDKEVVVSLATLPSKQELQGKLVWVLQSPISGFARVLSENLRGLVQVLDQIKDKKALNN